MRKLPKGLQKLKCKLAYTISFCDRYILLIQNYRFFKNIEKKYSILENGEYFIASSVKPFLCKREFLNRVDKSDVKERIIYDFIISALKIKIKDNDNQNTYKGQAILRSINGTCKIFDFKHQTILTMIDENYAAWIKNVCDYFEPFLKTTFIEINEIGMLEKYIKNSSIRRLGKNDQLKLYHRIITEVITFIKAKGFNAEISISEYYRCVLSFNSAELSQVVECCMMHIPTMQCLPTTLLHCDIHFGNVLYNMDSDEIYYIDVEHTRNEVFFYDIFNCAYVEYVEYNNDVLLYECLSSSSIKGMLDKIWKFENYTDIRQYAYCFLICRMSFDLSHARDRFKGRKLSQYQRTIVAKYKSFLDFLDSFS